jgi:hypothetical protein
MHRPARSAGWHDHGYRVCERTLFFTARFSTDSWVGITLIKPIDAPLRATSAPNGKGSVRKMNGVERKVVEGRVTSLMMLLCVISGMN